MCKHRAIVQARRNDASTSQARKRFASKHPAKAKAPLMRRFPQSEKDEAATAEEKERKKEEQ
ncbi:hypothetical protein BSNK01_24170 [Bacillaceae bacterium]